MSLFRSLKPVVCKVRGICIGGGSDIALCCDMILMEDSGRIGYPPARLWGCPTTAMWVYRIGMEKAKRVMLTGDLFAGKQAEEMGIILKSCTNKEALDHEVNNLLMKMKTIPINQLQMQKLVINQAFTNMGLHSTQVLATIMDGIARHTPEGCEFKKNCEEYGFKASVQKRDQYTSKL